MTVRGPGLHLTRPRQDREADGNTEPRQCREVTWDRAQAGCENLHMVPKDTTPKAESTTAPGYTDQGFLRLQGHGSHICDHGIHIPAHTGVYTCQEEKAPRGSREWRVEAGSAQSSSRR